MPLTKLTSTDAFVVTDVPDAPATGVVRMGKKILQSSAKDLARSATYAFAAFGIERGGASAGVNAEGEAEAAAIQAFVTEISGIDGLQILEGKGVTAQQVVVPGTDPLAGSRATTVSGIVAAARWAVGGNLAGTTAAVEGRGSNPMADLVAGALTDAGVEVILQPTDAKPWAIWGIEADLLLPGTKPGTLTHQGAPMVKAKHVVPWGPQPVTTKAYLMLERQGTTVLPDFVTAAGGLVSSYLPDASPELAERGVQVATALTEVLRGSGGHADGVLIGACERAEAFLSTWTDFSPFGRPLAA